MCVFFLNFVSFFLLCELVYVFQSLCRSLQKNLIVPYEMSSGFNSRVQFNWNSSESVFGFLKEERNSVVIRRVNIGDPAHAGHFTDSVRMNLAAVLIRIKKRKTRR